MLLLTEEQDAITNWAEGFNQISFDTFLAGAGGRRIADFSSPLNAMPRITLEFVNWLGQNPEHLVPILQAAVSKFPNHEEKPRLQQAAQRIAAVLARQQVAGPPWQASLIEGVPMVNRAQLREVLKDLHAGETHKVIMVDGPSGSGRSHSWHLINYVARRTGNGKPIRNVSTRMRH
ncbi:MAG: hypothetical protein HQL41_16560 [Alphaproteobacteria bacterium]|nr:hypothetical protein [Alphaproteobacteria bacterium]